MMRTIMIFPQFENMAVIEAIRGRYDPLAELVRPHITLVFPFAHPMSDDALTGILARELAEISPFRVSLRGISRKTDKYGSCLLLNVIVGEDTLRQIHDRLYAVGFSKPDPEIPYVPHITVGAFDDPRQMDAAYEALKDMDDTFTTVVTRISVEAIGSGGESIIIIEKELA